MFLMVVFVAFFFTGAFVYRMLENGFLLTVRWNGPLSAFRLVAPPDNV